MTIVEKIGVAALIGGKVVMVCCAAISLWLILLGEYGASCMFIGLCWWAAWLGEAVGKSTREMLNPVSIHVNNQD